MTVCLTPGCGRDRIPAAHGVIHAHCIACERRLLAGSVGPGVVRASAYRSWHARARANILPTSVVGGIRRDAPVGAESAEASPQLQRLGSHQAATTATTAD